MNTARICGATTFVVMLGLATPTLAQSARLQLPDLSAVARQASESVDVTLDRTLLGLAATFLGDTGDEREVKELVQGIEGIYVKSFEFRTEGAYPTADVESLRKQLSRGNWTRIVSVRSEPAENAEVYLWLDKGTPGGLAILVAEPRELTIVNIVGRIDLQRLGRLEGRFGIPKVR